MKGLAGFFVGMVGLALAVFSDVALAAANGVQRRAYRQGRRQCGCQRRRRLRRSAVSTYRAACG